MRDLEKTKMIEMEDILSSGVDEPDNLADLFSRSVQEEMTVYSKS